MYHCESLTNEQISHIYREHMKHDFPSSELKPLAMIRKHLKAGLYRCIGLFRGDELCGYAFLVRINDSGRTYYLLDYFAVLSGMRGQGIGSEFLEILKAQLASADIVLCESEAPEGCTGEELETRRRRIDFYLRCGLSDTGVKAEVFGVTYVLLSFGSRELSAEAVQQAYEAIYRSFLPQRIYNRMIRLF
ncbi:MAG: GNAT family N-acetyltransferase [Ruminococcus sp.]|nr:GNAT family N-acetyltransferase [Ruminococcus sp.]